MNTKSMTFGTGHGKIHPMKSDKPSVGVIGSDGANSGIAEALHALRGKVTKLKRADNAGKTLKKK